ncbi:MAG TPA: hypothetical protein VH575_05380 [Gemmataceae bacterium]|jgi:hypothetical protein
MTATRKPTYWCANFDFDDVLDHGLRIDAWLLQYQYEHGGFEYQGNRRQKGRTTATWKSLREVEIGDWLMAYLSGGFFSLSVELSNQKTVNGSRVPLNTSIQSSGRCGSATIYILTASFDTATPQPSTRTLPMTGIIPRKIGRQIVQTFGHTLRGSTWRNGSMLCRMD